MVAAVEPTASCLSFHFFAGFLHSTSLVIRDIRLLTKLSPSVQYPVKML